MISLAPVVGLLLVAAITPGPNNFLVMTAAMQGGWPAAVKTVAAIVVGSLILFCLIKLGLNAAGPEFPLLGPVTAIAGAGYLMWLGFSLMQIMPHKSQPSRAIGSMSTTGLIVFQLLNPKAWVLMSVFVAGSASSPSSDLLLVTILVVVVSTCLFLWAVAGVALSSYYAQDKPRRWIDRVMGASLLIFSAILVAQQI